MLSYPPIFWYFTAEIVISWSSFFSFSPSHYLFFSLSLSLSLSLSFSLSLSLPHSLPNILMTTGTPRSFRCSEGSSIWHTVPYGTGHTRCNASWSMCTGKERRRLREICLLRMFSMSKSIGEYRISWSDTFILTLLFIIRSLYIFMFCKTRLYCVIWFSMYVLKI